MKRLAFALFFVCAACEDSAYVRSMGGGGGGGVYYPPPIYAPQPTYQMPLPPIRQPVNCFPVGNTVQCY
jgi:hypothetical protein